jgi:hypothetical protein
MTTSRKLSLVIMFAAVLFLSAAITGFLPVLVRLVVLAVPFVFVGVARKH